MMVEADVQKAQQLLQPLPADLADSYFKEVRIAFGSLTIKASISKHNVQSEELAFVVC